MLRRVDGWILAGRSGQQQPVYEWRGNVVLLVGAGMIILIVATLFTVYFFSAGMMGAATGAGLVCLVVIGVMVTA